MKVESPWTDLLLLGLISGALVFFWTSPALIPLKILIVLFHELSHALMTIATGGEVVSMTISADQGGEVLSRGGNRFLTLSAGYLGSLLFGCVLYLLARGSRRDALWSATLAVILGLTALIFTRNLFGFGFSLGAAIALGALARWGGASANDLVLKTVGLASMLYVPADIVSDTLTRAHLRSDARMLAEEFGGMTQLWGLLWLLVAVATIGITLYLGWRRPAHGALPSAASGS
ncbi:MAG: M50 family metallopeptidase [Xanthomonadales bacterium]|nr:M50 family metallopeptidase [Xanthomonadales bacterium]